MLLKDRGAALRWRAAILSGRTGRLPLLLSTLPCGLLAFWLGVQIPHTTAQQESLTKIQSQLRVQVPLDSQQPALESHITPSEYQLVGLVFDRLSQGGLRVEASRYQLDENAARPALLLDIPLQGEYLPLVESLEALARTLPLEIEQITLKRASPLESQLSVTVRLRLLKVTP
ncbi:hypothetical protein [Pantoea sp.]|uniref:hypothetical protein n=1 Tax=Pantoea sp. TaxID=69393 RepID=UPI0025DBF4CA|nr:hypothetical protein [Pantoea sp.]